MTLVRGIKPTNPTTQTCILFYMLELPQKLENLHFKVCILPLEHYCHVISEVLTQNLVMNDHSQADNDVSLFLLEHLQEYKERKEPFNNQYIFNNPIYLKCTIQELLSSYHQ